MCFLFFRKLRQNISFRHDLQRVRKYFLTLYFSYLFVMISKGKIKFIKSLNQKKYRTENNCFPAEGNKLVSDILPYFECESIFCLSSWLATQGDIKAKEILLVEQEDIDNASLQKNPQQVIAIFRQPSYSLQKEELLGKISLVLDGIQDPGNFGTIIRLADWFGIENIICSRDTVDVYNPKTVQATMGAIARVKVHYAPLEDFISDMSKDYHLPVYGTFLDGENIYQKNLSSEGLIIMGNEGNGISPEIERFISQKLYIPHYPEHKETSESLNVAIATAIICAEFRRRQV